MADPAAITRRVRDEEGSGSLLSASTLLGPATFVVALGLLLPILILFRYSFNKFEPRVMMVEAVTLENYVKFFTDPFYTNIFWTTLRVALVCTVVCLVLAFPLAYVLARTESRYKNVLVMLVVLPLFVGNAVRAAGWMTLFGSKGALNAGLMSLGAIDVPLQIMFTEKAVIIGIIAVNLPYMVLTLPGVIAGAILCFILAMNAYATPVLLGGPQFKMMGPLVFGQFRLNNWPFGAAIAFVLMTATLVLTASANLLMQRRYRRGLGG
jgi:putative spermidine/putrescine transport system permease protein